MRLQKLTTATALAALLLLAVVPAAAQDADEKKHLLVLGGSDFFAHDAVSHAMIHHAKIGERTACSTALRTAWTDDQARTARQPGRTSTVLPRLSTPGRFESRRGAEG